jgi:hypothetical protein
MSAVYVVTNPFEKAQLMAASISMSFFTRWATGG